MSSNRPLFFLATVLATLLTLGSNLHAQQSKPWVAPKDAESIANPVAANPTMLKEVKKLYVSTCAPCHGEKGKGDGPAAVALNPKPADHTSDAVQRQTDGALFWMISTGRNSMPAYKAVLTETQRWQLIDYIRTFAKH